VRRETKIRRKWTKMADADREYIHIPTLNTHTGKVTALTLLDLSPAFDTIDYSVLLDHISDWSGISVKKSFLKVVPLFPNHLFLDQYCLLCIPHD